VSKRKPRPLLTIPETAEWLNISVDAAWRLRRDEVLPVVKLGGKGKSRVRVRPEDVEALIAAAYSPATSGPLANR
jgi:predicted DNA-binding transcriptional regulator AlpA